VLSRPRSEEKLPRFPLSFSLGVVPAPVGDGKRKSGPLLLQPRNFAVQLPGSGACLNYTLFWPPRIIRFWRQYRIHDPFCPAGDSTAGQSAAPLPCGRGWRHSRTTAPAHRCAFVCGRAAGTRYPCLAPCRLGTGKAASPPQNLTKACPRGCYRCVNALFRRARKWYYSECCSGPRRLRLRFQRLQLGSGVFLIPVRWPCRRHVTAKVRRAYRENSFPPRSAFMTGHCARRLVTNKGAVTGVTAWIVAGPAEGLTARCPTGEHSTLPSTGSPAAEPAARLVIGQRGRRGHH
jgi:hypothetical protein